MSQHFISTTTAETRCPRCHKPLLSALDGGIPARVDATPLADRAAEIAALLDGRWTYTHTTNRHLIIRDADLIAAGTLRGTIHAEHKCAGAIQLTLEDLIGQK